MITAHNMLDSVTEHIKETFTNKKRDIFLIILQLYTCINYTFGVTQSHFLFVFFREVVFCTS